MREVIINADDFGLCESVNLGIVQAMRTGIVSSTTLMVNMNSTNHAVGLAHQYQLKSIGIHLNLTKGPTILPKEEVPLLYNDDLTRFDVRKNPLTPTILFQIKQELTAQIEKFFSFGLIPTHLDSHHHIHMIPGIDEVVLSLALKYQLPIRTIPTVHTSKVKMPDYVDCSFYGKNISKQHLEKILLSDHKGVFEIMTHPGYLSDELMEISIYNTLRSDELAILTNKNIIEFVKENNIKLVSFAEV